MTTLEEELRQAATRADEAAFRWDTAGLAEHRDNSRAEAARLRARALHIEAERRHQEGEANRDNRFSQAAVHVLDRLCGPLPGDPETKP